MTDQHAVTNTKPQPSERERERERDVGAPERCPECSGRLVSDEANAETRCGDCGLVVTEGKVDPGPEWRAFDATERDRKSRVGMPTTPLMHDKGLSTTIGWKNEDANGRSLGARKRTRLARLRRWDERCRTRDSKDRNLKQALGEIDRMASALGLPGPVRETASAIYRRALDEGLLPGRSIEGVATATLYAAARIESVARSVEEVAAVSRVDTLEVKRTYWYVSRELDLAIPPTNPAEYVGRFASDLGCTDATERRARDLIESASRRESTAGNIPSVSPPAPSTPGDN
jgi:transcription initiation factor TFIIB